MIRNRISLAGFFIALSGLAIGQRVGINTLAPDAPMHVVASAPAGGPVIGRAIAVWESNDEAYLQMRTNNFMAGIVAGNGQTAHRSGMLFGADSTLMLITGGGLSSRMKIDKRGRVGINTITPLARLHVQDSSVLFTGPGTLPGPLPTPVTGAGSRMMWYADKAAFRVGSVDNHYWNTEYVGINSFASGYNTRATGPSSFAIGTNTYASESNSFACGVNTSAQHNPSFASGSYTIAKNVNSASFGDHTVAFGTGTIATGYYTFAYGQYSSTYGMNTKARALCMVALGRYNDTTSVAYSDWIDTDPVFVIGNGSANNARKNAFTVLKNSYTGINTVSPQTALHVVKNTTASNTLNSNTVALFDSNQDTYLQVAALPAKRCGLIKSDAGASIRSGVVFEADSSISLVTNNITRLRVMKNGNVGIGTPNPQANLHIEGGFRVGTSGSIISSIFHTYTQIDIPNVPANSTVTQTLVVSLPMASGSVIVSPEAALPDGLIIAYARLSTTTSAQVKFTNVTGSAINPPFMGFYVTVIQ